MSKKISYLFTLCFVLCIFAIEYLALTSNEIKYIENTWDKSNHFIAFFVLYVLLYFSHLKLKISSVILFLLIFAFQIEIVQYFLPHRYFSFLDIFADSIGIFMGILFSSGLKKYLPICS